MFKNPFVIPSIVFTCLVLYGIIWYSPLPPLIGLITIWGGIALGSWQLLRDTLSALRNKSFALDYIAILAITTGMLTENYVVAAVIVLMMSGGNALEEYAQRTAKRSLTALKNRLPSTVQVVTENNEIISSTLTAVAIGSTILIRKGEVVPLDGVLIDTVGVFDESSLTGEAEPVTRQAGEVVRSGIVNVGEVLKLRTRVTPQDSTYQQIVKLVQEAEAVRTPFVQLADSLSGWFTLVTLLLAALAYILSGDVTRVLAVLVIATPCPLILATPIAMVGGMSAAARHRIIFKRLASLEALTRIRTLALDKTGTLTLGKPQLTTITITDNSFTREAVLSIAASIEKNSLHPFAKAIVATAEEKQIKLQYVEDVSEIIGSGLQGRIGKKKFSVSSDIAHPSSQVVVQQENKAIAVLSFEDTIKDATTTVLKDLQAQGLSLYLFTGDTAERAAALVKKLGISIEYHAALSPAQKLEKLKALQQTGKVAMIGDGINDAPALAAADVGIVFSHQEHTAASEAADVILLGGDVRSIGTTLAIAQHTLKIAKQSIYVGVGLSLVGMSIAVFGFIPPLSGAIAQEIIDVVVILNALRAARWKA